MGNFASYEDIEYPQLGRDEFQECTVCGGKGWVEFPSPHLDPSYDPCPAGCDEMDDPTPVLVPKNPETVDYGPMFNYSTIAADRMPITQRRDAEIARLARAVDTVKHGPRHKHWRWGTRSAKPTPDAVWVGNPKTGYWRYYR